MCAVSAVRTVVLAALFCTATAAPAADLILDAAEDFIVPVQVNGVTLRLRVDPAANGVILVNADAAQRAGLRETRLTRDILIELGITDANRARGYASNRPDLSRAPSGRLAANDRGRGNTVAELGPVRVVGRFSQESVAIDGRTDTRFFSWFDGNAAIGADGIISPAALPYDTVTLRLRPRGAEDREIRVPVEFRPLSGLFHTLSLGETRIPVKFSLSDRASIVTAAAGSVIADANRGRWTGEARRYHVTPGVMRPARPMRLDAPLAIRSLDVRDLMVRTADHRGNFDLPADSTDPDEILVTARSGQAPRFHMIVGLDRLASCSSISYRRAARQMVLTCPG